MEQMYFSQVISLKVGQYIMNRFTLKESMIMKIHYVTGLAAMLVVAIHILMRLISPYNLTLQYDHVILNYHNLLYAAVLESILVLISIHGFNGLRIILLELRQGMYWENGVIVATIVAMIAVVLYGTRTIIIASGLGL